MSIQDLEITDLEIAENEIETQESTLDIFARTGRKVTIEDYKNTANEWTRILNDLQSYDGDEIRKDIATWDLEIPGKNNFDSELIAEVYSAHQSYIVRLTHLIGILNSHVELYGVAKDNLFEIACGLTGTKEKVQDKKSTAAFLTESFARNMAKAKALKDYLWLMRESIQHGSMQMSRILKEKEFYSTYNQNLQSVGMNKKFDNNGIAPKIRSIKFTNSKENDNSD